MLFLSLISLLRFRPIFPNGCGQHTPILQLLHTPIPEVLPIPQTELLIFPPTPLPILCFPSQLTVLSSHPGQKHLNCLEQLPSSHLSYLITPKFCPPHLYKSSQMYPPFVSWSQICAFFKLRWKSPTYLISSLLARANPKKEKTNRQTAPCCASLKSV